jgi:hypothetical protein
MWHFHVTSLVERLELEERLDPAKWLESIDTKREIPSAPQVLVLFQAIIRIMM